MKQSLSKFATPWRKTFVRSDSSFKSLLNKSKRIILMV